MGEGGGDHHLDSDIVLIQQEKSVFSLTSHQKGGKRAKRERKEERKKDED